MLLHNDFLLILHHTKRCIETPSFYKNISIECIYFHGSAASGPASYEGSHERQSRDLVNLLGLFPSFGDECLVNNRKEKKKKIQVSFFQPVLSFGFFSSIFFF